MQSSWILYSLLGMFILSVTVGIRMLQLRYRAVLRDKLDPAYFKLNEGAKLPDYLVKVTHHYDNLYETPVLFYAIVILAFVLHIVDAISLSLAYGYLISRVVHALVHLNSNRIRHRQYIFLLSILLLTALWIYVFIKLSILP